MKTVYLAYSVTNGAQNLQKFRLLISCLGKRKYKVIRPTSNLFPESLADVSMKSLKKSKWVIADISTYSHGVGFELGYAYALEKNILVICEVSFKDKVSKFLLGLFPDIIFYNDKTDLEEKIVNRLQKKKEK